MEKSGQLGLEPGIAGLETDGFGCFQEEECGYPPVGLNEMFQAASSGLTL
jgi:hypothetical protein